MTKTYYTKAEIARRLGVDRRNVDNWERRGNGRLPTPSAVTNTGMKLWTKEQVDQIIEQEE